MEELTEGGILRRYAAGADGLAGKEGVFVACSFWLVECLARQGRLDEAHDAFRHAVRTGNDLSLFAEGLTPLPVKCLATFPRDFPLSRSLPRPHPWLTWRIRFNTEILLNCPHPEDQKQLLDYGLSQGMLKLTIEAKLQRLRKQHPAYLDVVHHNQRRFKMKKTIALAAILLLTGLYGCATQAPIMSTSMTPAASGEVKVTTDANNNTQIQLKVLHLAPPQNLQPPRSVYVVWVETTDNKRFNLGQLRLDKDLEGKISGITPFKAIRLIVTAEDFPTVSEPSQTVVLTTDLLEAK